LEDANNMSSKLPRTKGISDWIAYYRILIDDIKFAKRQQWNICYYTLLIFGAIIGLTQIKNLELRNYVCLIISIAAFIAIYVSYLLIQFQMDIWRYRKNAKIIIENKFPYDIASIASYPKAASWKYYVSFPIFAILIILAGFVAVLFVLLKL